MKIWNHNKIACGGDYDPEQWDEATWQEDMRLFKLAHIDTVTLNVFSWAAIRHSEEAGIAPVLQTPAGVEAVCREDGQLPCSGGQHPSQRGGRTNTGADVR